MAKEPGLDLDWYFIDSIDDIEGRSRKKHEELPYGIYKKLITVDQAKEVFGALLSLVTPLGIQRDTKDEENLKIRVPV